MPSSRSCPIISRQKLAEDIVSFWLEHGQLASAVRPGQFVNLRVNDGPDPILRRPISVADVSADRFRLVFRITGRGTSELSRLKPGDRLDVLGPLGRPAPSPHNRHVVICGGGVGIAPLLFLSHSLAAERRISVVLGARSRDQLILRSEFRRLRVPLFLATDDGSIGFRGPVTAPAVKVAKDLGDPVVFACGPRPMLADLVRRLDPVPVWGFVERRLGCGTGICYCCALPRHDGGYLRFCQEGPVVLLNKVAV